jgi:hypothetical protein
VEPTRAAAPFSQVYNAACAALAAEREAVARTQVRSLKRWIIPALRVAAGVLGIAILFLGPENPFVWPLLLLSVAGAFPSSPRNQTRDISTPALVVALSVAGIIVLLLAIPETWWVSFAARIPSWAKQRTTPFWARLAITLGWAWAIGIYFRRLRLAANAAPPDSP